MPVITSKVDYWERLKTIQKLQLLHNGGQLFLLGGRGWRRGREARWVKLKRAHYISAPMTALASNCNTRHSVNVLDPPYTTAEIKCEGIFSRGP